MGRWCTGNICKTGVSHLPWQDMDNERVKMSKWSRANPENLGHDLGWDGGR